MSINVIRLEYFKLHFTITMLICTTVECKWLISLVHGEEQFWQEDIKKMSAHIQCCQTHWRQLADQVGQRQILCLMYMHIKPWNIQKSLVSLCWRIMDVNHYHYLYRVICPSINLAFFFANPFSERCVRETSKTIDHVKESQTWNYY